MYVISDIDISNNYSCGTVINEILVRGRYTYTLVQILFADTPY